MNIEYNNFIGYYRDVFPIGYCNHLISEFDRLEADGVGTSRFKGDGTLPHVKDDYQITVNLKNHDVNDFENKHSVGLFFNGLQECYNQYTSKYSVLQHNGTIRGSIMKMQRTGTGGGYHVWHAEQGGSDHASRVLVYMLYLNNLDIGQNGETEFLYQQLRVPPEENMLILWPASYPWAHRGNPVYGNKSKYVVTGWFYYD